MAQEIPERMATMEATAEACRTKQDERHEEIMSRIRRIEDRYNVLLLLAVGTLLSVLGGIAIALLKK